MSFQSIYKQFNARSSCLRAVIISTFLAMFFSLECQGEDETYLAELNRLDYINLNELAVMGVASGKRKDLEGRPCFIWNYKNGGIQVSGEANQTWIKDWGKASDMERNVKAQQFVGWTSRGDLGLIYDRGVKSLGPSTLEVGYQYDPDERDPFKDVSVDQTLALLPAFPSKNSIDQEDPSSYPIATVITLVRDLPLTYVSQSSEGEIQYYEMKVDQKATKKTLYVDGHTEVQNLIPKKDWRVPALLWSVNDQGKEGLLRANVVSVSRDPKQQEQFKMRIALEENPKALENVKARALMILPKDSTQNMLSRIAINGLVADVSDSVEDEVSVQREPLSNWTYAVVDREGDVSVFPKAIVSPEGSSKVRLTYDSDSADKNTVEEIAAKKDPIILLPIDASQKFSGDSQNVILNMKTSVPIDFDKHEPGRISFNVEDTKWGMTGISLEDKKTKLGNEDLGKDIQWGWVLVGKDKLKNPVSTYGNIAIAAYDKVRKKRRITLIEGKGSKTNPMATGSSVILYRSPSKQAKHFK